MTVAMIVGDLHLGKGLSIGKPGIGTAWNSRINDQVVLLNWLLDQALEYNVETIILTGDIFQDVKPDYLIVDIFFKFLKNCELHNIDVHIIAGNHDIRRTGIHYTSILDLIESWDCPHITVYKQIKTLNKGDVYFTLFPFRDKRSLNCESVTQALEVLEQKLPYELAEIPANCDRVLVGHLALEGSLPVGDEIDDYNNELLCPLKMFKGYDYVWMGHIHKPQVRSQSPYIAHIGSLDISDFGETDHQKVIVIYNPTLSCKFLEIPVPSRPLRKLEIVVPDKTDVDITKYVTQQLQSYHDKHSLKNCIFRLEIKLPNTTSSVNRSVVEQFLQQLGVYYICNFTEHKKTTVVPLIKQNIIDNSVDPKSAVKLFAKELKFDSDELKNDYIKLANSIIDKYYLNISK